MIEAMRLAHRHLGLVLEPSGAAGIAAILENRARFVGQTVATILCGGNLTAEQMASWLGDEHGLRSSHGAVTRARPKAPSVARRTAEIGSAHRDQLRAQHLQHRG